MNSYKYKCRPSANRRECLPLKMIKIKSNNDDRKIPKTQFDLFHSTLNYLQGRHFTVAVFKTYIAIIGVFFKVLFMLFLWFISTCQDYLPMVYCKSFSSLSKTNRKQCSYSLLLLRQRNGSLSRGNIAQLSSSVSLK
uniref:Uncharacterized protein n=1 Tax=Strigamia maritima TaxID=126957 RepID=T1JAD2_STRMM